MIAHHIVGLIGLWRLAEIEITAELAALVRYATGVGYFIPCGNPSPKLTIPIDSETHENILAGAAREGLSASARASMAAREALQRRAGLAAVAKWEKKHGRFTLDEMEDASRNVRTQLLRAQSMVRNSE